MPLNKFIIVYFLETKNQWARDDPAFLVLLMIFLVGKNTS